jgi:hypothetical protein
MPEPAVTMSAAVARAILSEEAFGALINLSSRRRFTSQRLVLYAMLAALGIKMLRIPHMNR